MDGARQGLAAVAHVAALHQDRAQVVPGAVVTAPARLDGEAGHALRVLEPADPPVGDAQVVGGAEVDGVQGDRALQVEQGLTVAQPLKESGVFPPMVVQMIGVGEQTGAMDAMLSKIADFYEEEVDQAVANMLTLMEPIMIVFLGGSVGGIVIAMYMPLFAMISQLS